MLAAVLAGVLLSGRGTDTPPAEAQPTATAQPVSPPSTPEVKPITLPAGSNSYIGIAVNRLRCRVDPNTVICEMPGSRWPAYGAKISANGQIEFADGNLGLMNETALEQLTYSVMGWTVTVSPSATRFVNEDTGHGAQVTQYDVLPI